MMVLAWKNVFRNKTRTLLTSGGIAVGILVYLILASSLAGLLEDSLIFSRLFLTADLVVEGGEITPENVAQVEEMKEVRYVEQGYQFVVVMKNQRFKAVAVVSDSEIFPVEDSLVSGTLPKNDGDLLIPELVADSLSINVGDDVLLTFIREDRMERESFHVAGVFSARSLGFNLLLPFEKGEDLAQMGVSVLFLNVNHRYSVSTVEKRIKRIINPAKIEKNETILESVKNQYAANYLTTKILSYLILLVAGLGILNTMTISAVRRKPEIGILKSLGMGNLSIFFMFLHESILIIFFGILIGLLSTAAAVIVGERYFSFTIVLHPSMILSVIFLFLILGVLFTLYPAYVAAQQSAMKCLREQG